MELSVRCTTCEGHIYEKLPQKSRVEATVVEEQSFMHRYPRPKGKGLGTKLAFRQYCFTLERYCTAFRLTWMYVLACMHRGAVSYKTRLSILFSPKYP